MSQVNPNDVTIENGIAIWDLNLTAPIGGTYQGTFKFRCALTPMQELEADRDYRELLGKNAEFANTRSENLAYTLSQLRQRVIQGPPFWNDGTSRFPGGQIKDSEILEVVLEASVQAEIKYREQLRDKHKKSIESLKKAIQRQEHEADVEKELAEADAKQS